MMANSNRLHYYWLPSAQNIAFAFTPNYAAAKIIAKANKSTNKTAKKLHSWILCVCASPSLAAADRLPLSRLIGRVKYDGVVKRRFVVTWMSRAHFTKIQTNELNEKKNKSPPFDLAWFGAPHANCSFCIVDLYRLFMALFTFGHQVVNTFLQIPRLVHTARFLMNVWQRDRKNNKKEQKQRIVTKMALATGCRAYWCELVRSGKMYFRLFCCCLCTLRWLVCVTNDVLIHTPNRARWHMRDDNDSDKSESGPTEKRGRAHTPWFMQMIAAAGSLYCARFEKQTDVASNRIFVPIHLSLSLTAANWFGPNFVQMPKMCTFRVVTKKSGIFQEWLSDRGQLKRHMQKNCFDKMHKLPFTSSQHISPFFVRTKPADRGSGPNGER